MNFHDLLKSKLLSMNLREELLSLGRADVEIRLARKSLTSHTYSHISRLAVLTNGHVLSVHLP